MSFIRIINGFGPHTDPCSTPDGTFFFLTEFHYSLLFVLYARNPLLLSLYYPGTTQDYYYPVTISNRTSVSVVERI